MLQDPHFWAWLSKTVWYENSLTCMTICRSKISRYFSVFRSRSFIVSAFWTVIRVHNMGMHSYAKSQMQTSMISGCYSCDLVMSMFKKVKSDLQRCGRTSTTQVLQDFNGFWGSNLLMGHLEKELHFNYKGWRALLAKERKNKPVSMNNRIYQADREIT